MPLTKLGAVRIIRCLTDEATARERVGSRAKLRSTHADASILDDPAYYNEYVWPQLDVPSIDVKATNGYEPTVQELVDWVASEPN